MFVYLNDYTFQIQFPREREYPFTLNIYNSASVQTHQVFNDNIMLENTIHLLSETQLP
jgi:hypothetical protein